MSATSETEICNLALTRLGHQIISNLTEGTKGADLCNLHYARTRDALLRSHPWNFAIKRATLAQSSTSPNHEFTYYHALPADCLKVIRTSWEACAGPITEYRIEGRFLACDEDTVKIEYVARITDTAQFDESFTDVLAQRLAGEICVALTDNQAMAKTIWDIYQVKLADARVNDAQEGTPREVVDLGGWIVARG